MTPKSRKILTRCAWALGITFLVLAVVLIVVAYGAVNYALDHPNDDYSEEMEWQRMKHDYPQLRAWSDSIRQTGALRDSNIINKGGQRIHVYWLPAPKPTHRTALLVHGYTACAIQMMQLGYMYHHDLGYNIFLYDQYAHGKSEGKVIQMGWKDRLNALECARLIEHFPAFGNDSSGIASQLVVHGISMGAATTMMLSGEPDLPKSVKAFVEDCGYTSVWDEFYHEAELMVGMKLPSFPLKMASWVCRKRYGWDFEEASSLSQVKKCKHPMLFIHGDNDDYVPTWMVHPLYEAHHGPKSLWLAPGSAHAVSYRDHPQAYTQHVEAFLRQYFTD